MARKPHMVMMNGDAVYQQYCQLPVNRDVFERIKYLSVNEMYREVHIIATKGNKIIGDIGLHVSPFDENTIWVKHVSVDPEFRRKGIARAMVEFMFDWFDILGENRVMELSSYSEDGKKYLQPMIASLRSKYKGVTVLEPKE